MAVQVASAETTEADESLQRLRAEIERLDGMLIQIMAQRIHAARLAGRLKRAAGLPEVDPAREARVVRRAAAIARSAGLFEEDVRDVFWRLIAMSRRAQAESGPDGFAAATHFRFVIDGVAGEGALQDRQSSVVDR